MGLKNLTKIFGFKKYKKILEYFQKIFEKILLSFKTVRNFKTLKCMRVKNFKV